MTMTMFAPPRYHAEFPSARSELRSFVGKTVLSVELGETSGGYQYVIVTFTDGSAFRTWENSQTGQMVFDTRDPTQ